MSSGGLYFQVAFAKFGDIIVIMNNAGVGNGLDRSADLQPTSDSFGTVKTVPYIKL